MAEVPVQRRLRVAFFSTGDELRSIGEPLDEGCVYDSNRYTLYGMLTRLGCDIIDMGVVQDDPAALEAAFRSACENADAIITSGGVSVGAADYTKQIMAQLGDVTFWKIGMRPGRPMAFGKIASAGHSAYPVRPARQPGGGDGDLLLLRPRRAAAHDGRRRCRRCRCCRPARRPRYARSPAAPNTSAASSPARRRQPPGAHHRRARSGILRSMSEANCMVVLGHEQGNVQAGDLVDVLVFEGLV